jgi:hypothetical protein
MYGTGTATQWWLDATGGPPRTPNPRARGPHGTSVRSMRSSARGVCAARHDLCDLFRPLCYAMLCYAMLCCAVLCYAMLCYAMLCYAMPCHAMLCYAML